MEVGEEERGSSRNHAPVTSAALDRHTPGPWRAEEFDCTTGFWAVTCDGGDIVYATLQSAHVAANARLIAAAPELLEAVRQFTAAAERGAKVFLDERGSCLRNARAAIAKATGQ